MAPKSFFPFLLIHILFFSCIIIITINSYSSKPAPALTQKKISFIISNPTPAPLDWQTYINEKYQYLVRYKNPNSALTHWSCTAGKPSVHSGDDLLIISPLSSVKPNEPCFPLEGVDGIEISVKPLTKEFKISPAWQKVIVDNNPAYKHTTISPQNETEGLTQLTQVDVVHNNYVYSIYLGNLDLEDTFADVVSEFKFTWPPTSSTWKTYTDTQNHFEIMYPVFKFVQKVCLGEGFMLDVTSSSELSEVDPTPMECGRDGVYPFQIIVDKKPFTKPFSTKIYQITEKNTTIGGVPAKAYTSQLIIMPSTQDLMPPPEWYTQVFFENKGVYYEILFTEKDQQNIFSQILSTFKFIAPTPSTTIKPTSIPTRVPIVSLGCKTGGCSSELCSNATSENIMSPCIYRAEYACLRYSRCEKQTNGNCGWTNTPEYLSCLSNIKSPTE